MRIYYQLCFSGREWPMYANSLREALELASRAPNCKAVRCNGKKSKWHQIRLKPGFIKPGEAPATLKKALA